MFNDSECEYRIDLLLIIQDLGWGSVGGWVGVLAFAIVLSLHIYSVGIYSTI